jgi:multiple sugar transport system ATP-binding protein
VDQSVLDRRPALEGFEGKMIILGLRPEDIEDAALATDAPEGRRLSATVDIREDMGSEVYIHFAVSGKAVRGEDVKAAVGEEAVEVAQVKGNVWVARVDRDTGAREQKGVELVVDTTRLHFFDPASGEAIY